MKMSKMDKSDTHLFDGSLFKLIVNCYCVLRRYFDINTAVDYGRDHAAELIFNTKTSGV